MSDDTLVTIDLSDDERELLASGLNEWGGPASGTDALARAMDFTSLRDLFDLTGPLVATLRAGEALSARDWRRVLLATEIVFASDVVGSGWDWSTTTGISDAETIVLLRGVQRKLLRALPGGYVRRQR